LAALQRTRCGARLRSRPDDAIRAREVGEQDPRVVDCSNCSDESAVTARLGHYDANVQAPERDDNWFDVTAAVLNAGVAHDWVVRPECGAVTLFSGTVRDHADGRDDVVALTYEAYEEKAIDSFAAIADELRNRWPDVGRVLIWHRIGRLELCEVSVIVAVSSPHRPVAFEAARFAIDALKVSSPIWKHEEWSEGSDWGTGASPIERPRNVASEPN